MGVNAAGLRSKMLTFKKVLKDLIPSVLFVTETKLKDAGKLKIDDYIVFEKVRKNRENGGGLAIGCIPELKPIWVREGDDQVEALSINIFVKKMMIRCCVGYGCQESDLIEKNVKFCRHGKGPAPATPIGYSVSFV